ncbi:peroxiredoxin [Gimesia panareensis]|uniref:thioredoxin-dependent peroxiredoxin n=1 Tax=Gimesia panareensis TaxID=2527978 RepID=A0A518A0I3_9PLAN|nr:peroxiredoxin [Gimesia panareensis]QDT25275.1 Putative peroxiredoxin bcp [Gimesia panareensis]QDU48233.1 Putative peroxiredoxin bcp [Gimesia panareensis]
MKVSYRSMIGSLLSLVCLCGLSTSARGQVNAPPGKVDVGDSAPAFTAKDDQGKGWKSTDYVGKKILVVYFYPADMTGGCTKQACGFRDDMKKLQGKDVEVVGVSGDSVRNHQLFKKEYDLNFTLLADEDGSVAKKFGVPLKKGGSIEREIDGKKEKLARGVTAARWTFVIDKNGKVVMKNTKVKAAEDSKAILKKVNELK